VTLIVDRYVQFVNDQVEFQTTQSKRFASNAYRRDLHLATATNLRGLFEEAIKLEAENAALHDRIRQLETASQQPTAAADSLPTTAQLSLKPEDLEGLPKEVIDELSVSGAEPIDFKILSVINDAGGISTLDRIIIGLYRNYQETIKRPNLTSRLNRMIPKGLLYSVPGRKGVYSTNPLSNEGAQIDEKTS
jgi:hypothetical protein